MGENTSKLLGEQELKRTIELIAKENPKELDELLEKLYDIQGFITDKIIGKTKEKITNLAKTEQYDETVRAISNLGTFKDLRQSVGHISGMIEVLKQAEEATRPVEPAEIPMIYEGWQKLSDIKDGKGLKYTNFKFQVDGVDKPNSEIAIKSAKDVTVHSLKVAYELNPSGFKELAEEGSRLSAQWKMPEIIRPAFCDAYLKASHKLAPDIYIETGFAWERRVMYIKHIYELLGLDVDGILVKVRNDIEL